jgi:CRISPR-associated protein Cmr1
MPTIEAEYRAVTPVFCAGADPNQPELRAPSFKGVLRFWWRALAWSRLGGDLRKIHDEEERVFGGPGVACSRVKLQVAVDEPSRLRVAKRGQVLKGGAGSVVGDGARYLGYGLMEAFASREKNTQSGELLRACYLAPFGFRVRLRYLDNVTEADVNELARALRAVGLFGGVGARTRRGYGSVMLRELRLDSRQPWRAPDTLADCRLLAREFMPAGAQPGPPPFTALSRQSRILLVKARTDNALELLNLVGREMVWFRSWGKGGKILGSKDSEKRFTEDHDLMKLPPSQRNRHPQRIAFGLPHNYGKRDADKVEPAGGLDRRASPLFIHIHECGDGPVAVLAFLPAQFLPGTKICVGSESGKRGERVPREVDLDQGQLWKPVTDFLDRFTSRKYKEPFTEVVEVPER